MELNTILGIAAGANGKANENTADLATIARYTDASTGKTYTWRIVSVNGVIGIEITEVVS